MIPFPRSRQVALLAVGLGMEAILHFALRIGDPYVRGLPGVLSVVVAVFVALYAGALAGALVALGGWAMFATVTAETTGEALVVLPVWVLLTFAVGRVAERLREAEAARVAMHELRTPAATIAGMAASLREYELEDAQRERLIELIEAEARKLLEARDGGNAE